MFDVIGLGCATFDFLGIVPEMPQFDDEIKMSTTSQQGGGEVATALVTLAKLGSSVAFIGKVGDDLIGEFIKQDFNNHNIDISNLVVQNSASSPVSMILISQLTGDRAILACQHSMSDLLPSDIDTDIIERSRYLHLDGYWRQSAIAAAKFARDSGVKVVLDADVLAYDSQVSKLIELTDIVIASKNFSRLFSNTDDVQKSLEVISSFGPSIVGITLGSEGSFFCNEAGTFHTPAFQVEVVDTTGAGDVFHGAFIRGLLEDWELCKVVEFASAVAAIKCTKLGGREGIPNFDEALEFLTIRDSKYFN